MVRALSVVAGGAIGSLARYLIGGMIHESYKGTFPLGTLIINISGSLLIGLLWGLSETFHIHPALRMFVFIGLLGGFTTFSSFSVEALNLFKNGELLTAGMYILATNILGLAAVFSGYYISQFFTNKI